MSQSDQIGELAKALCAVQGGLKPAVKNCTNPFFRSRYADLGAVIDAAKPLLAKNGLAITQGCDINWSEGACVDVLTTILSHSSGQYVAFSQRLNPAKDDPQGLGAAITYARRYGWAAALGIVADDDDDGNTASAPNNTATDKQVDLLKKLMHSSVWTADERDAVVAWIDAGRTKPQVAAKIDSCTTEMNKRKKGAS